MSLKKRLDMETILNATAELVEEKGLENVTLLQVAEKLGVKSPSLYNHLSGLKELSAGLAQLSISRLEDTIRNAVVGRSKDDALMEIAFAYRNFAKENPELYKAILKLPAYENNQLVEGGHCTVRILYQVMEQYHCSEEDTIHFVRVFSSALHGFVSLEAAGFFKAAADADESYRRLVSGLISIFKAQEGG